MIIGIGTDIVDARRIEALLARHDERARNRLFTEVEQAYAEAASDTQRRILRYANRFAAKEAAIKALGHYEAGLTRWTDIMVERDKSGAPSLQFAAAVYEALQLRHGLTNVCTHLSLSDEFPYSVAYVIIEGRLQRDAAAQS